MLTVSVGNGWYRGRLGFVGGRALYGDRLGAHRPARDRLRRRAPAGRRHRRVVARRRERRPRRRPLRRPDHRRPPALRRLVPAGDGRGPAGRTWLLHAGADPGLRHRHARSRTSARRSPARTCCGRCGSGPRRRGGRWWTSGRTWSAGSGSRCAGPRGQRDPDPARGGARARRARRPPAARRAGHRPVHPQRRRGLLRADHDLPRLPLRRGHRLARRAAPPDDLEAVVVHSDLRAHRILRVLRADCSTSCTATSCGAPRATSSTCPPTARSATSGSAGPATSRCSRPPRRTCSTSRRFLADWLLDLAAEQEHADGMVPFVVPDVLKPCPSPGRSRTRTAPRSGATPPSGCRGRSTQAYGDRAVLERQYDSMTAHVRRVETLLSPDRPVGHALPVRRLARPGRAAGRAVERQGRQRRRRDRLPATARPRSSPRRRLSWDTPTTPATFRALADRTREAFNEHYVADDGTIRSDCTTVYTLAIVFGLLDEEQEHARGRAARPARRQERPPHLDRLRRHAVHHRRAHQDRSPRRRLPAPAPAGVPVLALPGDHGRHHGLGAVGLDAARRHHQPRRDDQLQPLRPRRGGRLDAPHHRRTVAAGAGLRRGADRSPPRRRPDLGRDRPGDRPRPDRGGLADRRRYVHRAHHPASAASPACSPSRASPR